MSSRASREGGRNGIDSTRDTDRRQGLRPGAVTGGAPSGRRGLWPSASCPRLPQVLRAHEAAGEEAVLTVLARREAKLGLILYDMKKAAADIAAMI